MHGTLCKQHNDNTCNKVVHDELVHVSTSHMRVLEAGQPLISADVI